MMRKLAHQSAWRAQTGYIISSLIIYLAGLLLTQNIKPAEKSLCPGKTAFLGESEPVILPVERRAYMSSRTSADAPPPPLQTPATPSLPFLCFKTCRIS